MFIIIAILLISNKICKEISFDITAFSDTVINKIDGNDNRFIYYPELYFKKKYIDTTSNKFLIKYNLLNKLLNSNITDIKKKKIIENNNYNLDITQGSVYKDWNFIF